MVLKTKGNKKRWIQIAAVTIAGMTAFLFWVWNRGADNHPTSKDYQESAMQEKTIISDALTVKVKIEVPTAIDYKDMGKDNDLTDMMDQRKKNSGVDKSMDFIVRSDESFKIGETTVSMKEILKKSFLKRQGVFEEMIRESGELSPENIKEFGVYVVRPGDNLWNIHFRILQEYYSFREIKVMGTADEPLNSGFSSGVGKLLKFSEGMVIIYNLVKGKIVTNLDLIEPLSKVVVYNMDKIFSLLEEINYDNVDKIRFDGETIWIPADQPVKENS